MKLLEAKRSIEQYFLDSYTLTTVHWSGTKFDVAGKTEWIYFEYTPEFVSDNGLDNSVFSQDGTIKISIISKNPFRCSQIADDVIDIFKGKNIFGLFAKKVRVISQDYIDELGKTALDLDIYLTTY